MKVMGSICHLRHRRSRHLSVIIDNMKIGIIGGVDRSGNLLQEVAEARGHQLELHTGVMSSAAAASSLRALIARSELVVVVTDVNSHNAVRSRAPRSQAAQASPPHRAPDGVSSIRGVAARPPDAADAQDQTPVPMDNRAVENARERDPGQIGRHQVPGDAIEARRRLDVSRYGGPQTDNVGQRRPRFVRPEKDRTSTIHSAPAASPRFGAPSSALVNPVFGRFDRRTRT